MGVISNVFMLIAGFAFLILWGVLIPPYFHHIFKTNYPKGFNGIGDAGLYLVDIYSSFFAACKTNSTKLLIFSSLFSTLSTCSIFFIVEGIRKKMRGDLYLIASQSIGISIFFPFFCSGYFLEDTDDHKKETPKFIGIKKSIQIMWLFFPILFWASTFWFLTAQGDQWYPALFTFLFLPLVLGVIGQSQGIHHHEKSTVVLKAAYLLNQLTNIASAAYFIHSWYIIHGTSNPVQIFGILMKEAIDIPGLFITFDLIVLSLSICLWMFNQDSVSGVLHSIVIVGSGFLLTGIVFPIYLMTRESSGTTKPVQQKKKQ